MKDKDISFFQTLSSRPYRSFFFFSFPFPKIPFSIPTVSLPLPSLPLFSPCEESLFYLDVVQRLREGKGERMGRETCGMRRWADREGGGKNVVERPPTLLQKGSVKPLTLISGLSESRARGTKKLRAEKISKENCVLQKAYHIESRKRYVQYAYVFFPRGKGNREPPEFSPLFEMGLDCAEIRRKSKKGKENFLPIPRPDLPPDPNPCVCPLMSRPAHTYYSHSLHERGAEPWAPPGMEQTDPTSRARFLPLSPLPS